MYIVIICSLLALMLTYLDSTKKFDGGMKWGFILVTLLAVIHYDYGNDYMGYYDLYRRFAGFGSIGAVLDKDLYRDIGWSAINYVFQYLGGFFSLVAVISIFEGVVYYRAIRRHLPRELWWFGTFIYLFATSFYLLNFSMLRQGLVIAIFIALYPLIEQRKWLIAAPILYLCSFIHGSALVLVPFAFWGFLPVKRGKALVFIFSVFLVAMYVSSQFLASIPQFVMENTDAFEYYEDTYSESDTVTKFGIGFIIYLIPTIITILFLGNKQAEDEMKRLVALSCLGAFFTPLATIIPMIGRVGMYFGVFRIMALPIAYKAINNKPIRIGLIALYIAIIMYDYCLFFNSEVFGEHYRVFRTIFGHM
jgi:hypothetical protein